MASHYFFKRNGPGAARAYGFKPLFGNVNIFQFIEMLYDRFAGVICLGTPGAFGETSEAFFDFFGKAYSEHGLPRAIQL